MRQLFQCSFDTRLSKASVRLMTSLLHQRSIDPPFLSAPSFPHRRMITVPLNDAINVFPENATIFAKVGFPAVCLERSVGWWEDLRFV